VIYIPSPLSCLRHVPVESCNPGHGDGGILGCYLLTVAFPPTKRIRVAAPSADQTTQAGDWHRGYRDQWWRGQLAWRFNGKRKHDVLALCKKARGMENTLGMRTTGNTNPARTHHEKRTVLKRFSMFIQHPIELFDFGWQGSAWKPKEDNAGVGKAVLENQLAEIAVCHNENPLLVQGNGKHIFIGKPVGVVARDRGNVMAKRPKVSHQSEVRALVKQKIHRAASDRVPFGGLGETSSPVTIALA
jgi:hypothetical protein